MIKNRCVSVHPFDGTNVAKSRGSKIEKEYRLIRDSNFNANYVEVGERDISEYVNSFKEGCSLNSILQRCALMPVRDKIAYLQQETGVSADLTKFPKDGTEAAILINEVKRLVPDLGVRLKAGESYEDIVKALFKKTDSVKETVSETKSTESEVSSNG